jgi:transposase-like protein
MKCPYCGSENVRKAKISNEQRESKNAWRCVNCGRIFYVKPEPEENTDQSVYSDDPQGIRED